ncbi:MAG: LacI family DNA-binding transcriptional regulator [Oscillospiraceae bacterium]
MSNIKDVAKMAGVSIATVSRVINNTKKVSPAVRTKVEEAIRDLNYQTNEIARGLKVSKTNRIATIITSLSRTFFSPIIEGIHTEAARHNYSVIIAETQDNLEQESQLVDFFANQWVDGIILASSARDNDAQTRQYIKKLGNLRKKDVPIPVVTLEFPLDSDVIDAVSINNEQAAFDAVTYLIQQVHRRNILHVSHPFGNLIGDQRIRGYKRALECAGLPVRSEYIVEGNYTTYSGYGAMKKFLASGLPVDAVYCANDQTAVGVLKACESANISIPEDVAILGTDDVFAASIVSPTLSSISIPKFEMGENAMSLLHRRICSDEPYEREIVRLDYEIIERESTKKGKKNSLRFLQW